MKCHEIYLNSVTRNSNLTQGTNFHHGRTTYHLRAGLTAVSLRAATIIPSQNTEASKEM